MRYDGGGLGGARRVLLHGVTGSGKSTLAARISALTGIPWFEADSVNWLPGWRQRDVAEQRQSVAELVSGEAWVLDSAYRAWRDLVLPRAELVVALDLPRVVSLRRLLRRTVARIARRTVICNGNTESLRGVLSGDSIVAWHFRSFGRKRRDARAWEADATFPPVIRLTSSAAVEAFLRHVAAEQVASTRSTPRGGLGRSVTKR